MNQAIFVQIFVRIDALEGEQEPIFAQIHDLSRSIPATRTTRPHKGQDPRLYGGLGFNDVQMVQSRGQCRNPDNLLGDLMELAGRQTRRRALRAMPAFKGKSSDR